ncbi:MAG: hypothetical protein KAX19_01070 [Candidatus Brocadiae bacterium]|nr:hypothetical protein [Candidatus Brocadiia bacterium]
MTSLPAITGNQLIKLLKKDGWVEQRRARHGMALVKAKRGRLVTTIVPMRKKSLPSSLLSDILGPQQTGIGRRGLQALIQKHGIK